MKHADSPPWMGLVLAGGQSSRMGRDKASLPWHGMSLLEHMRRRLRDAGASCVITLGRDGEADTLHDERPGQGPLSALAQAAPRLPDGVYLVTPVDMPLLSVALLRGLANAESACACFRGHRLPMKLRLDAAAREILADLDRGLAHARSIGALQARLATLELDCAPWTRQLRGCNTEQEWQALLCESEHPEREDPSLH